MDALMAALVAALLATFPDRPALIAAASQQRARTIAVTLVTAMVMACVSSGLGNLLARRLAPSAQLMMLAAALALIGIEFLSRKLSTKTRGGLPAAIVGSGLWFVVLALAMRSTVPWLAIPGAVVGMTATVIAASAAGPDWGRLPLALARRLIGGVFLAIAATLACSAIGIV